MPLPEFNRAQLPSPGSYQDTEVIVIETDGRRTRLFSDGVTWGAIGGPERGNVLNAATAGQNSGWIPYVPGMRLSYALDSGSTSTAFSIDISENGSTSLGQAFTGTWASSVKYEITPPIYLTNQAARFIRFNVLGGGPLSVNRNV